MYGETRCFKMKKLAAEKRALTLPVCMTFSFSFCISFLKFTEKPVKNKRLQVKKKLHKSIFFLSKEISRSFYTSYSFSLKIAYSTPCIYQESILHVVSSSRIISHHRLQSKICALKPYRTHFSDDIERSRVAGSL